MSHWIGLVEPDRKHNVPIILLEERRILSESYRYSSLWCLEYDETKML